MNYQINTTAYFPFTTHGDSGKANATGTPACVLYVNGTADAATVTVTNPSTGAYVASVTIPNGASVGDDIAMLVSATVGGVDDVAWIGRGYVDATISSRLSTAGYTAPDNASISATNTRVLLALPAEAPGIDGGLGVNDGANGIPSYVTGIAANAVSASALAADAVTEIGAGVKTAVEASGSVLDLIKAAIGNFRATGDNTIKNYLDYFYGGNSFSLSPAPSDLTAQVAESAVTGDEAAMLVSGGRTFDLYTWFAGMVQAGVGSLKKFTAAALSLAPTGSGGGGENPYATPPVMLEIAAAVDETAGDSPAGCTCQCGNTACGCGSPYPEMRLYEGDVRERVFWLRDEAGAVIVLPAGIEIEIWDGSASRGNATIAVTDSARWSGSLMIPTGIWEDAETPLTPGTYWLRVYNGVDTAPIITQPFSVLDPADTGGTW